MNPTRRTFIAAGIVAAATLAATRLLPRSATTSHMGTLNALDQDGEVIVRALVPAMLAGALPDDLARRSVAIDDTVRNVDSAIAGLPPFAQKELRQMFTLFASAPGRVALLHSASPWDGVSASDADAFLERLRSSRWSLLRSAYDALHQLLFASWYARPETWTGIGYGGPPRLA